MPMESQCQQVQLAFQDAIHGLTGGHRVFPMSLGLIEWLDITRESYSELRLARRSVTTSKSCNGWPIVARLSARVLVC